MELGPPGPTAGEISHSVLRSGLTTWACAYPYRAASDRIQLREQELSQHHCRGGRSLLVKGVVMDDHLAWCEARALSPNTLQDSYGYPLRKVPPPFCERNAITGPAG